MAKRRPRTIRELFDAHETFADSLVDKLDRRLRLIGVRASARTINELQRLLDIENGIVLDTPNNQRVLRHADKIFTRHLDTLGFTATVAAFSNQIPRQLPFIENIFRAINRQLKTPLPIPDFSPNEAFLQSRITSGTRLLELEKFRVAEAMAENALLNVGATTFDTFREALAVKLDRLQPNISALAATVMSTNFRVMNDRAYQVAEEGEAPLKYVYYGPRDKLNRPFCRWALNNNEPRTRKQINRLNNRSTLKPTFTVAGGFNCRHIWIAAVKDGDLVRAGG